MKNNNQDPASSALSELIQIISDAIGYGGGRYVANKLQCGDSIVSKLRAGNLKLDSKTLRAAVWIFQEARDEDYESFPILKEVLQDPYIIRARQVNVDAVIWTWRIK